MKIISFLAIGCLTLMLNPTSFEQSVKSDDIIGEWYTDNQGSIITIYKKENLYFGDITWIANPYDEEKELLKDIQNPDKTKRNRPIEGITLLHHFKFDGKDTWEDGIIYNVENGKDYSGVITLKDTQTLVLRGYIGMPMFGQSVEWKRR